MRFVAYLLVTIFLSAVAWAEPVGKWANLDRYPNCDVALDFKANGSVFVPNPKKSGQTLDANWRLQGATLIITDKKNDWESYYDYKGDSIVWKSVKTLGKTQNISNQFSLQDRTMVPCK